MNRDLGLNERLLESVNQRPQYDEKRRHARRQLSVHCWMGDGAHTIFARIHDVSLGGLSMRVPVLFSLGTQLEIILAIPSSGSSTIKTVRARAEVVWLRATEGGPRMGTRFLGFPDGDGALRKLVP